MVWLTLYLQMATVATVLELFSTPFNTSMERDAYIISMHSCSLETSTLNQIVTSSNTECINTICTVYGHSLPSTRGSFTISIQDTRDDMDSDLD